jgi:hypothetical protein
MADELSWILWSTGAGLALGVPLYLYSEWKRYQLNTTVVRIPAGRRFKAHLFTVDMQRKAKKVRIRSREAHFSQQAREAQPAQDSQDAIEGQPAAPSQPAVKGQPALERSGALDVTFDAPGLRIEFNRMVRTLSNPQPGQEPTIPTGWHSISFIGTEEDATLRLDHVPSAVAEQFLLFAKQIQVWVERLEEDRRLQAEAAEAARIHAEEEEEKQAALKAIGKAVALAPNDQIAQWRRVAGFTGTTTEMGLDSKGAIEWFVDLDPTGRITLHSGKQPAHTTLKGATITSLVGELELNVLDAEGNPDPHTFRILKGHAADVRRAWKERLSILRDSLSKPRAISQ